jgi:hypothetical protein
MFKSLARFFDLLEDKVRARLSHRSILYALIGGVMVVLFWRGVWHTADILMVQGGLMGDLLYEPTSIVWTSLILLMTGLFVSSFIGERIVISGLKREKKVTDKTEIEVAEEEIKIKKLEDKIDFLINEVSAIKNDLAKK